MSDIQSPDDFDSKQQVQGDADDQSVDGPESVIMVRDRNIPDGRVEATPELRQLFALAARVNRAYETEFDLSFSSLLIAFLAAGDPWSRWFQSYAGQTDLDVETLLARRNLSRERLEALASPDSDDAEPSGGGQWRVTTSAASLIGAARSLRQEADPRAAEAPIDVRDLMAAYIYRPVGHQDDLTQMRYDRPAWSTGFLGEIARLHPAELDGWRQIHRATFGSDAAVVAVPAAAGVSVSDLASRLPPYNADDADGPDLLGIEDDVDGLAAVIAAKTVVPPLSIGLFGDWGSGKTFFIRRLRQRVDQYSRAARATGELQKNNTFYKHIVQIEFNAWHYVESNLWASLVEHLFSNLRVSGTESEEEVLKREEFWIGQMKAAETARTEARTDVAIAQQGLDVAKEELARCRVDYETETKRLAEVSGEDVLKATFDDKELKALVQPILADLGIQQIGESVGEMRVALTEALAVLHRGNNALTPLVRGSSRERAWRWVYLSGALIAVPVATVGIGYGARLVGPDSLDAVAGLLGGVATLLGTGTAWLRNQSAWVTGKAATLERANERLEQRIVERGAEKSGRVVEAERTVDRTRDDYAAALRKQQAADQRVKEVEAHIAELAPVRVLARFIDDRAASNDYRKHLGTLAIVRRDFAQLSDLLDRENRRLGEIENPEDEERDQTLRINRVVLYIDDLDRCPPQNVVQVLQAVHLLLALKLFVVVVGVDARWVTRSLQDHYDKLLRRDGADANGAADGFDFGRQATPLDYLEKIFQIPYWLEPLDAGASRAMLRGLVEPGLVRAPAPETAVAGHPSPLTDPPPNGRPDGPPDDGDGETPAEPGPTATPPPGPAASAAPPLSERAIEPNPKFLEIGEDELAFMEVLAPLLSRSPRSIKRFVNVYRLIKASVPPPEREHFLQREETYSQCEIVMLLLSIDIGCPGVSRAFSRALAKRLDERVSGPQAEQIELASVLDDLESQESVNGLDDFARLRHWFVSDAGAGWRAAPVARFADWTPRVARYSFWISRAHS